MSVLPCLPFRSAQAEVLTPRDKAPFIDVTLAFLEHCDWRQVAVAPKYGEMVQVFVIVWYCSSAILLYTGMGLEFTFAPAPVFAPLLSVVGDVCHMFAQVCISEGRAAEALLPLRTAAYKMGSATPSLTPVHPEFMQVRQVYTLQSCDYSTL